MENGIRKGAGQIGRVKRMSAQRACDQMLLAERQQSRGEMEEEIDEF